MNRITPPNPAPGHQIPRFRTNPIEWAIFAAVSFVFCSSAYNLFYDQQGFHPAALTPMAANPTHEGRSPASVSQELINVTVHCDTNADSVTTAGKVRLAGSLCGEGRSPAADASTLVKTEVVNAANKFAATVFTDTNGGKYSTDYLPLVPGRNAIHVEFTYQGGKVVAQDVGVVKN